MVLKRCIVDIVNNRVECQKNIDMEKAIENKNNIINNGYNYVKNKDKLKHLMDIGINLENYHPSIIKAVVDAGRDSAISDVFKPQLELIAKEAGEKGFSPAVFGYNNKLHKNIKKIYPVEKKKGKGSVKVIEKTPKKQQKEKIISSSSSSETDTDEILSDIEDDIKNELFTDAEEKLDNIKNRLPLGVYKKLKKTIK